MKTRQLTLCALLSAVASGIFVLESQIPAPLPGVKLGLANGITMAAVFLLGWKQAAAILFTRIILGSLCTGLAQLPYSLVGGLCSILAVLAVRCVLRPNQLWVASALGGMAHNIGQIAVAIAITQTPRLLVYLPVLLLSGLLTGIFTGLCAQFAVKRLKK